MPNLQDSNGERLSGQCLIQAFARLQPRAFGLSCGVVGAVGLFLVTAILYLKGPAAPGLEVGPHLELLAFFVPWFTVSWGGALIGTVWGLVVGYLMGLVLAGFINFHHRIYINLIARGVQRQGLFDG